MDITRINYTVDTCSMPSIEFNENLWTIIHDAMSILVVQNDPGFVSNYWVREYLCVRLKQSTFQGSLLWRLRTGKWDGAKDKSSPHRTVQYIANLDLCLLSQPSPPFLRSTSPHDVSTPGRLEGYHQLDLSDEESARQPTAMHKWLGFVSLSWAHDVFEYTTYVCMQPWVGVETSTFVETEDSLAGNEWLERPSVFPACMVHIQIENRLGLFFGSYEVDISTIFQPLCWKVVRAAGANIHSYKSYEGCDILTWLECDGHAVPWRWWKI